MKYKEINIDSKTDRNAWLEWRNQGIGASDASIIMGVSRFKSIDRLKHEKAVGIIEEKNSYIAHRGNEIEFQVRMFFEKEMKAEFPAVNLESTIFPFLRASLDGRGFSDILEIKLVASIKNDKHVTEGTEKWDKIKQGWVPDEYWPQVQLQLWISGANKCYFVAYKETKGNRVVTADKLAIVEVRPDKEYQKKMLKELFAFWLDVLYLKEELVVFNGYKGELE